MKELKQVEYFRCWAGSGGDSGTWDTDYIEIPKETDYANMDKAILAACQYIDWEDEIPVLVGLYSIPDNEDD